jgi:hypothetical protein
MDGIEKLKLGALALIWIVTIGAIIWLLWIGWTSWR